MARTVTQLTETKIKTSKPKDKDYKLSDGGGLFLLVTSKGSKLWRLKYRFDGKEKLLSLGKYPSITLSQAREKRDALKSDISSGINPSEEKQIKKQLKEEEIIKAQNTFRFIALERLALVQNDISESHYKRTLRGFENDVFPLIGDKFIDEVIAKDIISVLHTMLNREVYNSAKKVHQSISKTFKYAVANGKATRNPASDIDLTEIVNSPKAKNYPTITDDKGIKNLLLSIKEYKGETSTKNALLMLAYTFVRPSNIRLALWEEINLESKQWVIPAKKMKRRKEFIVPLTPSIINILEEMKPLSGDKYVFPSTKSRTTPLSDGALLGAIRRMGYSTDEFTPHGFRAMFSTIAHEKSPFNYDVIETQLAHIVGNTVSQAYNRAKYLDERVKLMQWWSDYLDEVQG